MTPVLMAWLFLSDRTTRRRMVERIARRLGASRKRAARIAFFF